MDISKILDFHRMVMISAAQGAHADETSCGPLCQHPACWDSNRRKERGVPRKKEEKSDDEEEETNLPTMNYYNMLEDYGESNKDRYPARYGGRAPHERSSSMRNPSQPLRSGSFGMTTAPYATPVSPEKGSRPSLPPSMKIVEVQEVFDKSDLNSRWDETFVTRQCLVWVPNPNRQRPLRHLAITDRDYGSKQTPKMLLPRDLTETMVPLQIKYDREETMVHDGFPVLKKKQNRSRSPIFTKGGYPKTPYTGAKPDVDAEGVRELLSLPREVLLQVLDRTKESDFVSREKIHGIIQEVLDTARDGRMVQTARDLSPTHTGKLHTSDVLVQQKVPLHYNKQRNIRDSHLMEQRPVFQLDDEDEKSSTVDTARDVSVDASSTKGPMLLKTSGFAKLKKPLPSISGEDSPQENNTPRRPARRKIPSISLGLPELPSCIRQTKPFAYSSKHRPDFTLVPVPTPPQSDRSADSVASEDHGTTTLHVNLPSATDIHDNELYMQSGGPRSDGERLTADGGGVLHLVSPSLSTNVPKAPAGTPATFQSPTKSLMFREHTAASSTFITEGRGLPPSREITMSPGHKIWVPGTASPGASPSPDELGLGTIQETAREQAPSSRTTTRLSQAPPPPPPQPPTCPSSLSHSQPQRAPSTEAATSANAEGQTGQGSPDEWPQVTEPPFDGATGLVGGPDAAFLPGHMADNGSALQQQQQQQRNRPDLGSRGSERSTLARRILDEGVKGESPAPPPPSPEPKEFGDRSGGGGFRSGGGGGGGKADPKNREPIGAIMEPLLEQTESEGSISPLKRMYGDGKSAHDEGPPKPHGQGMVEPVIQEETAAHPSSPQALLLLSDPTAEQFDPVFKVMVSHVTPRPSASREKLQQTFMTVDIPAEDMSSMQAEGGSTPPDCTPSGTASLGKLSPAKFSSASSSPVKRSSRSSPGKGNQAAGGKKGGKKNAKGAAGGGGAVVVVGGGGGGDGGGGGGGAGLGGGAGDGVGEGGDMLPKMSY